MHPELGWREPVLLDVADRGQHLRRRRGQFPGWRKRSRFEEPRDCLRLLETGDANSSGRLLARLLDA